MYTTQQYREAALKFRERAEQTSGSAEKREFHSLERSFDTLADNAEWLAGNGENIVLLPRESGQAEANLTPDEELTLRCLGAALIMQWDRLPAKLQRELFEAAEDIGNLTATPELRGRILRLFHAPEDKAD